MHLAAADLALELCEPLDEQLLRVRSEPEPDRVIRIQSCQLFEDARGLEVACSVNELRRERDRRFAGTPRVDLALGEAP